MQKELNFLDKREFVSQISFYPITSEELVSKATVICSRLRNAQDITNTIMDPKLGPTISTNCGTCNQRLGECILGHEGCIPLSHPCYNFLTVQDLIRVLNCFCFSCNVDKGTENEQNPPFLNLTENQKLSLKKIGQMNRLKQASEDSKKISECLNCGVKRTFYKDSKAEDKKFKIVYDSKETIIDPLIVYSYLFSIQTFIHEVNDLLDLYLGIPKRINIKGMMFFKAIPVIPIHMRQIKFSSTNEKTNEFNKLYDNIIASSKTIYTSITNNLDLPNTVDKILSMVPQNLSLGNATNLWKELQKYIYDLQNFADNNVRNKDGGQRFVLKSIIGFLSGKQGLGKIGNRCDFSARTVITAGPDLPIGVAGIPRFIARETSVPFIVQGNNGSIEYAKKLLDDAKVLFITTKNRKGKTINLFDLSNHTVKEGDILHRYLEDGDIIILNRQPTLHKFSMMSFEVRIHDDNTIKLPVPVCSAFNADFDGDEMTLHVPQTTEAIYEAKKYLAVSKNLISGQANENIIGVYFDGLIGSFLLTKSDTEGNGVILEQALFERLFDLIRKPMNGNQFQYFTFEELLTRAELNGLRVRDEKGNIIYSGRLIYSALFPRDFIYYKGDVQIINGILLKGTVAKNHVGKSSGSIVQVMVNTYPSKLFDPEQTELTEEYMDGSDVASMFITNAQRILVEYSTYSGFTMSLADIIPETEEKRVELDKTINDIIEKHMRKLESLEKVKTQDNRKESLEILGSIKGEVINHLKDFVNHGNLEAIIGSGAKGNIIGAANISALVGQQIIKGDFKDRSTGGGCQPYFLTELNDPRERGFCHDSFITGLTIDQIFNTAVPARQSLMATALDTSISGYLSKIMRYAFENIHVGDKNALFIDGKIIAGTYGIDGIDPSKAQRIKLDSDCVKKYISFINPDIELARLRFDNKHANAMQNLLDVIGEIDNEPTALDPEELERFSDYGDDDNGDD